MESMGGDPQGTVVKLETFISVSVDEKSEMGGQLMGTITHFFSGEAIEG